jgi:hypothetical protein
MNGDKRGCGKVGKNPPVDKSGITALWKSQG